MITHVKKQTIHIEKAIFIVLSSLCLSLVAMYMYFVSASVIHVVMRTEINQEITKLSSDISELEGKYIASQHRVSSEIASLQGYQETEERIFIDRNRDSLVLSTPINR
jgi:hypothetical protein